MMFFSDPGWAKGLCLTTHLSTESFNVEKVVVVRDDDDDDGACGLPLWESMSIAAVGAIDLDKSETVKFEMKPNWVKVVNLVFIYRVIGERICGRILSFRKGCKCWGFKTMEDQNH
ncbi:hypothetical protein LR48_Vigan01g075000 [Vigna angularis]|uniref:Uncharacterized protein n=1 Tax=Phaseolus angularis TaxID=3914 RepID=A0A0L9TKX0_PHAAN|nr:hypothetical protein LR48_Vigan01g075000 [Vigna angularis]